MDLLRTRHREREREAERDAERERRVSKKTRTRAWEPSCSSSCGAHSNTKWAQLLLWHRRTWSDLSTQRIFYKGFRGKLPLDWVPPGKRAVATIGACRAIAPNQSILPFHQTLGIIIRLLYFYGDSIKTHKSKKYIAKFRGLRPQTPFYLLTMAFVLWIQQYFI